MPVCVQTAHSPVNGDSTSVGTPSRVNRREFRKSYLIQIQQCIGDGQGSAMIIERVARVACTQAAKAGIPWRSLDSGYDMAYMEQEEAGTVPKSALGSEGGFGNNYGKSSLDWCESSP